MRRIAKTSIALTTVALVVLSGCSKKKDNAATSTSSNSSAAGSSSTASGSAGAGAGFAADATIGVALPDKTSENWVLAGKLFEDGLKAAGFKGDVQYAAATNTVADQQGQISAMITKGAKVIIIGAKDGSQLGDQLKAAKAAGATVIAYDRLILNTADLDYYVAFDNFKVGVLQGTALLEGMKANKPAGPYTIELFAGSPDDNNAKVFFDGAMSVLQPEIDKKNVVVGSGQTDFKQVTTQGWLAENSQKRMDSLVTSTYSSKTLDGVLAPNDNLARSIIQSVKSAGKPIPVVTGQDSEGASVTSIKNGEQYMTINKDTRKLVAASIQMAQELQQGKPIAEINDTKSYNNGVKVVPAYLLAPLVVTKANLVEAYKDDPKLAPLTQ
jgi:putative multiple sugar transport system substrate-binding protein